MLRPAGGGGRCLQAEPFGFVLGDGNEDTPGRGTQHPATQSPKATRTPTLPLDTDSDGDEGVFYATYRGSAEWMALPSAQEYPSGGRDRLLQARRRRRRRRRRKGAATQR